MSVSATVVTAAVNLIRLVIESLMRGDDDVEERLKRAAAAMAARATGRAAGRAIMRGGK